MKQKIQNILKFYKPDKWALISSVLIFILIYNLMFTTEIKISPNVKINGLLQQTTPKPTPSTTQTSQQNIISEVTLPIKWNDLGQKLEQSGVIDESKMEKVVGKLSETEKKYLNGSYDQPIVVNESNSRFILNLLWAFGLANKNPILADKNDMMQDPKQIGNYASTGGWTLSVGNAMDHFNKYEFIVLTPEQQQMVDNMSKNIYRPCCNNSTHFPDCNHGMAMLGLLELMVANNISEADAYKVALKINALWFPQTYQDLATYFSEQGATWDKVDAKLALSAQYSSASGYRSTRTKIKSLPQPKQGGGGCGI